MFTEKVYNNYHEEHGQSMEDLIPYSRLERKELQPSPLQTARRRQSRPNLGHLSVSDLPDIYALQELTIKYLQLQKV